MKHICLLPLVLVVPACLENDEELEIHPDGSLEVTLTARGDVDDLADGYPLPLDGAWQLASEDARRWALQIGGDTGSERTRARAAEVRWPAEPGKEPQAELVVRRSFGSVAELPASYAPAGDPYRGAQLRRDTTLAVEERGAARVYTFERVVHGFERARVDPLAPTELGPELRKKLEAEHALTPAERERVGAAVVQGHARAAEALARDALLGLFTQGGDLAARELAGVLEEVQEACAAVVTRARIEKLLALALDEHDDEATGAGLQALEREWRAALRTELGAALARRNVPEPARNAAAFALEYQFTAYDCSGDVGDDRFVLTVRLPGTLVGGNFTRAADGAARFEFEGEVLQHGDVVLRAVSVLE